MKNTPTLEDLSNLSTDELQKRLIRLEQEGHKKWFIPFDKRQSKSEYNQRYNSLDLELRTWEVIQQGSFIRQHYEKIQDELIIDNVLYGL